mmetsp:Transcript_5957/g.15596  ORF Transcript_5957/g.15596 Transcript_5957/m.15596 type:complete len:329 (-) Transcript_5957:17-1003(-)
MQSPSGSGNSDVASDEDPAVVSAAAGEAFGSQPSALSAIRSELSASDSMMEPSDRSAFALYVGLSRREERELQRQSQRSAEGSRALSASKPQTGPAQFKPGAPPLRQAQVLSVDAYRARMVADVESMRRTWQSDLSDDLAESLMHARPRDRRAGFQLLVAEELIPVEANPMGGTVPIPTLQWPPKQREWRPLQRLIEPYLANQPAQPLQLKHAQRSARPSALPEAERPRTGMHSLELSLSASLERPRTQGMQLSAAPSSSSSSSVAPVQRRRWLIPVSPLGSVIPTAPESDRGLRGGAVRSNGSGHHLGPRAAMFEFAPVPPDEIVYR